MSAVPEEALKIVSPADADPQETQEWLASLEGVLAAEGPGRAHYLLEKLIEFARINGEHHPFSANTPYINTIPVDQQARIPGDQDVEHKIRSYTRWNAIAMVLRAGKDTNVGGHIASFASAATLYDVGFNHFWHAPSDKHGGDLVFVQGHSSPGVYSRAFLLGRLDMPQLDNFRQEVDGGGLSSYPHPWLMPDFWQFPTVSMGLGPIMAIYQARFMKYLESRNIVKTEGRKVWAFLGDGETDEPESLGAIGMAGREQLDNLVFVINCNLQRLDGPVRGNGKIIQELESEFRGAGWNVIKVIWGSRWDPLLARDKNGLLMKRMMECVDGEYQTYKSKDGAYVREHFFNTPELKAMVADYSDEDIWALNRGGHDPHKIYAAYQAATQHKGQPTVILAKTIKGYGMGEAGQAMNITHQQKKMPVESLKKFRDQFKLPIPDDQIAEVPYLKFEEGSKELEYMRARRMELGGYLPQRRTKAASLPVPALAAFDALLKATAEGREISTTMAFVRILNVLLKDKALGQRIVPIVPDESRTFGMEGLFRQIGIWSQAGQRYIPQDHDQLMFYKESESGQILQEGINEAGGMCDWIAAATSYSTHGETMIPFYIFYSMFGFQRTGDSIWAMADQLARGFLVGATAGRTTLTGEGLQHADGHSPLLAATNPAVVHYDPAHAHEIAHIMKSGLERMYTVTPEHPMGEDVIFYLTVYNEPVVQPAEPADLDVRGLLKGVYHFADGPDLGPDAPKVQLLASGVGFPWVRDAQQLLAEDWGVSADLWSVTSWNELARDAVEAERWSLLHPEEDARVPFVTTQLGGAAGPFVAVSDFMRAVPLQIARWVPGDYHALGTDGFGFADTRPAARRFFNVDAQSVAVQALQALAQQGSVKAETVSEAFAKYRIDDPTAVSGIAQEGGDA